jgi:hypothetical protein
MIPASLPTKSIWAAPGYITSSPKHLVADLNSMDFEPI